MPKKLLITKVGSLFLAISLVLTNCSNSGSGSTDDEEIQKEEGTYDKPQFDKDNISLLNNSYDSHLSTYDKYFLRTSGENGIIGSFTYKIRSGTPGNSSYYASDTTYIFNRDGTFSFYSSSAYGVSGGYNTTMPSKENGYYSVYKLENEEYFFYISIVGKKSGINIYRYRVSDNYLVFTSTEDLTIDDYIPNDLTFSLTNQDKDLSNRCAYKRKYNGNAPKDGFLGTWNYGTDEVESWGNSMEGRYSTSYCIKNFELIFNKDKTVSYREYLNEKNETDSVGNLKEKEVYKQTGNFELVLENGINYITINFSNGVKFKYQYLISNNYLLFLDGYNEKTVFSILPESSKTLEIGDIVLSSNYFLKADDIGLGFDKEIQGFVWETSNDEITIMSMPSDAMTYSNIENYINTYHSDIVDSWRIPCLADVDNEYKGTRYYIAAAIYKLETVGVLNYNKCSIWLSDGTVDNDISVNGNSTFHMIYNINVFCTVSGLSSRCWNESDKYRVALLGKLKK